MKSKLSLAFSMAVFGTIAVFVRNVQASSATVALMRAVIATLCILLFQTFTKKPLRLKNVGKDIVPLFLSGAAMGFNWIFLFEAYRCTTVSVATLCYYFAPVIVIAACPVLFHERLTARQVICFAGSTAGLALVVNPGGISGPNPLKGVLLALAALATLKLR